MTTPELKHGDIVDIAIKGVRVSTVTDTGLVTIYDEHDDPYPMPPQAAIERVSPTPRPGDVWEDHAGDLRFVHAEPCARYGVMLIEAAGNGNEHLSVDSATKKHGPFTLAWRKPNGGAQ